LKTLCAQERELVEGGERVLLFATPAAELVVVAVELGLGGAAQGHEVGVLWGRRRDWAATLQLAGALWSATRLAEQVGELAGSW
jgi:hypothetical protein